MNLETSPGWGQTPNGVGSDEQYGFETDSDLPGRLTDPGGRVEDGPHVVQRVGLLRGLVRAPAQHPREPHGDPGPVPRGAGDPFEPELEDVDRLDVADRPEPLPRVPADPAIE